MADQNEVEILLIEDNPVDIELTLDALAQNRLINRIQVVHEGVEALDFLFCTGKYATRSSHNLKLIRLDIKPPKLDGLEVLQQLRADPGTKNIPVVILSSSADERDIFASYELGVNSYMVKPVDFIEFTEAVRTLGFNWLLLNHLPER